MSHLVIPDWPLIFWRQVNNVTEGWTKIRGVEHALASKSEFEVAKRVISAALEQVACRDAVYGAIERGGR